MFKQPHPAGRQWQLPARAFLIQALEELGESAAATQHCRAIGSKVPVDPNASYLPITKKIPVYPEPALRRAKTGWVIVEFTVDENGFTRNLIYRDKKDRVVP